MADKQPDWIALERARRVRRRELLGGGPATADEAGFVTPIVTGLALSGGGIRSATMSLGFLQALAARGALKDIDYLSTVSGGGYAGSFLCSLYTPSSVRDKTANDDLPGNELRDAADRATARLGAVEQRAGSREQRDGARALDWLRNSSRYLAPRGSSDYLYAFAMWIRNLIAVHHVIGVSLVGILMSLMLANRFALPRLDAWWPKLTEIGLLWEPVRSGLLYLLLALAMALFIVLPLGIGYWMTESSRQVRPGWWQGVLTLPSLVGLSIPLALMAAGPWIAAGMSPIDPMIARANDFAWVTAFILLLSWLAYVACWTWAWWRARETGGATMNVTRTKFTQGLANAMRGCLAVLSIALILIAAKLVEGELDANWWKAMSGIGAAALAAAAWQPLLTKLFRFEQERKQLSVRLIPLVAAAVGLALVVLFWGVVSIRLEQLDRLVYYALAAIALLSIITGRSFQFLNLSTIQNFYSARIVRAYLGATNDARFDVAAGDKRSRKPTGQNRWASITEPHPLDDMSLAQYYGPVGSEFEQRLNSLAPQHIINVTVNKTVGKTDTLVEQDRKGLPLAVTPHGYLVDGEFWQRKPADRKGNAEFEPLMLGRWIGISGAAFAPGLGRASRPELSLLTVLVNVRLGFWWKVTLPKPRTARAGWWWPVSTQVHLLREARGRFLGEEDSHWYLTDGGHFENTGVYELLRRRVDVIIALDNGTDIAYRFDDIANLIRIASLDFGARFEPMSQIDIASAFAGTRHEGLARLFGNPNGFECCSREDHHFLMAYRVHLPGGPGFPAPKSVMVVFVKPRLTEDASLDLVQYQAQHQSFPQEPTSDQFFDDEQWESYRKLGWCHGSKLLGEAYWGDAPPLSALAGVLNALNPPSGIENAACS